MPASLDDILTTQKNGVVAINGINSAVSSLFAYVRGSSISSGPAGTGSYAKLYTVPTGRQVTINDIEICNTGSSPATFYISLVPSGGTAGASNALFYAAPINGNTTVQWSGQQILGGGGFVSAYASSSNITIKVNGAPG